jgi:trk system potassium uptake protein TrkA
MRRRNSRGEFVIVGLDSFGENVALALVERGHQVLGIDRDREIVQRLADNLQDVVVLDATDPDALAALGIEAFDTAVVAIGGDLAQAMLVTLTLKELGVRRVVCEAQSERNRRVLLRIGADEVVTPDVESARAVADLVTGQAAREQGWRLGNHLVIRWSPRHFSGPLGELLADQAHKLQVMMLSGRDLIYYPSLEAPISPGDELLIAGPPDAVRALMAREPQLD